MKTTWALRWLLTISSVSFCEASAQSHEAPQEVTKLSTFYVKAWHFEQDVLEMPSDVVSIHREQIRNSSARDVPELLRNEANLLFSNISGSQNVAMRGFGEGSGLRSLILVDGQPLNPADMGRINWEQIPLKSIESIEVLRGGQNVLYGDKALAGVIKIETRRPEGQSLEVSGTLGSDSYQESSFTGSIGEEAWNVQIAASQIEDLGYRDHSAMNSRNLDFSAGYTSTRGDDIDLRITHSDLDIQYPGGLTLDQFQEDPRISGNLGDEGSIVKQSGLTLRYDGIRDWGNFEILSAYDENQTEWSFGADAQGLNKQFGFNLRPRAQFQSDLWTIISGIDLQYDELDFERYIDPARTIKPSEATLNESRMSTYSLIEYEIAQDLTLSTGLRHEWVRYEVDYTAYVQNQLRPIISGNRGDFPNLNYKPNPDIDLENSYQEVIRANGSAFEVSLNYRLNEKWSLWTGYDRSYRYPVFDERATYQGFPQAENTNTNLEAEEGDNFEIGLKYRSDRQEFSLTAFLLLMENEIIYDPNAEGSNTVGNTNVRVQGLNINLGPVRRYGTDLAWFYEWRKVGISTRLAFVHTEMRSGEGKGHEVPLVPEWHSTSQLWYEPIDQLRLSIIHRYVGARYQGGDFTNSLPKSEAYDIFDFSARVKLTDHAQVHLGVNNLFDETYAESAFFGVYYPGRGRFISAGFELSF